MLLSLVSFDFTDPFDLEPLAVLARINLKKELACSIFSMSKITYGSILVSSLLKIRPPRPRP